MHEVGCEIDTMKDIVTEDSANKLRLCAIAVLQFDLFNPKVGWVRSTCERPMGAISYKICRV